MGADKLRIEPVLSGTIVDAASSAEMGNPGWLAVHSYGLAMFVTNFHLPFWVLPSDDDPMRVPSCCVFAVSLGLKATLSIQELSIIEPVLPEAERIWTCGQWRLERRSRGSRWLTGDCHKADQEGTGAAHRSYKEEPAEDVLWMYDNGKCCI